MHRTNLDLNDCAPFDDPELSPEIRAALEAAEAEHEAMLAAVRERRLPPKPAENGQPGRLYPTVTEAFQKHRETMARMTKLSENPEKPGEAQVTPTAPAGRVSRDPADGQRLSRKPLTATSSPRTDDSDSPFQRMVNAVKDHHRAFGAALKYVEAAIVYERLTTYLNDREADRALSSIEKAIQDARPVLDRGQCSAGGTVRPGGDAYFGPELDALHKLAYVIDAERQIFQEDVRVQRKAIRQTRSIEPFMREMERHQLQELANARFKLPDAIKQELDDAVGNVLATARRQPQLFEQAMTLPAVVSEPAPTARTDRHAELRAALIANPDLPQAAFVERFRVHPITVRRCRRELEEAGTIRFLAHRHGPEQSSRRCAKREAAD
jgi:hypothetical protein